MRLDDHLMTILTGGVMAVLVGFLAQNGDSVIESIGAKDVAVAADDRFTVRAGRVQPLDVLLNDEAGDDAIDQLKIVTQPSCGTLSRSGETLAYGASEACFGMVSFSYCLDADNGCDPAVVVLNVRPEAVMMAEAEAAIEETPAEPLRAFVVSPVDVPQEMDAEGPSYASLSPFISRTDTLSLDAEPIMVQTRTADIAPELDPIKSASLIEAPERDVIGKIRATAAE